MAYVTKRDVRMALTGLTSDPGVTGDASTAASMPVYVLDDAIEEACNRVDNYLRARYAVPVTDSSALFYVARDIAAYLATLTFKRNEPMGQDDPVQLRYNDAMIQLVMWRDGKAVLDLPPAGAATDQSYVEVVERIPGGLFCPGDFFDGGPSDVYDRMP